MRSRNVIVSGIGPSASVSDKELVEPFCESNLTIKPRVVRAWRIGKDKAKLCITLESAEAVDDLIDSSSLLRNASDYNARHIYFNRDQTKQQAQAPYNKRCLARMKRQQPTETGTVLNPQASSFHVGDQ